MCTYPYFKKYMPFSFYVDFNHKSIKLVVLRKKFVLSIKPIKYNCFKKVNFFILDESNIYYKIYFT